MRSRNSSTQSFQPQNWSNGPSIKYEHATEQTLTSPSLAQHQAFAGPPWSTEAALRYQAQALPHHAAWGPVNTPSALNTNQTSYAPSVLSSAQDSSPLIDGIATPESASRSPMFSNLAPNSAANSSNGGDPHQISFQSFSNQTPRQIQTTFQPQNVYPQQDISPQSLMIDPTSMHQLHRDPSPSTFSDFVLIDKDEVSPTTHLADHHTSQAKQKKSTMKRPRVASTSKVRQEPDNFVSEHPARAAGPIRRQSSSAAKIAKDNAKRVGGRSLGMHLTEEAAARAKQLRDEGSCWICCFQRDSVRLYFWSFMPVLIRTVLTWRGMRSLSKATPSITDGAWSWLRPY